MKFFITLLFALLTQTTLAQAECHFESDCPAGYQCNSSTHECKMGSWPNGGCTWESDCLDGYQCDSSTHECKMGSWPNGGCTWESDCLDGYQCDSSTHKCRMGKWPNGGCTWDSDCLEGYHCSNRECEYNGRLLDAKKILKNIARLQTKNCG